MKKEAFFIIINLFFWINLYPQVNPNTPARPTSIEGQLPSISPPSPTVAGLMKFEEVPVNHYTGIPDVSVPLYSVETLSADIRMDIALKYHPGSIPVEETASYTGLGWSLFAGGSISRTVKGSPDEQAVFAGGNSNIRIGILQDNISDTSGGDKINRYEQVMALQGTYPTGPLSDMIGEYGWGVAQKGIFDTQRDLFQYNFMGNTGRFFIKRDQTTGALVAVKLDNDNAITIKLNYSQSYSYSEHRYAIVFNGFELYDDKGYKYVFGTPGQNGSNEVKIATEFTEEYNDIRSHPFDQSAQMLNPSSVKYPSAFHLNEIYDTNNRSLVKFTYKPAQENTTSYQETTNHITSPKYFLSTARAAVGEIYGLFPEYTIANKTTSVTTQKLDVIEIVNKARIKFETGTGRYDSDLNADAPVLNSMTVKNWYGQIIKQYDFNYDYASISTSAPNGKSLNRMILTGVNEKNTINNTEIIGYGFSYKEPTTSVSSPIRKDYWGYFSRRILSNKEPDAYWCSAQVLEKITQPTGGSIVFDFGPNTYSYEGATEITDFSVDNDYWEPFVIQVPENGGIGFYPEIVIPEDSFHSTDSPMVGGRVAISTNDGEVNNESFDVLGDNAMNDGGGTSEIFTLQPNKKYYLTYKIPDNMAPSGLPATVKVFRRGSNGKFNMGPKGKDTEWLMGGGIRINKISYYTNDNTSEPAIVKHFDYQLFSNRAKSSGSLAYAKPLYRYNQGSRVYYPGIPADFGGTTNPEPAFTVSYSTTTIHNSLSYIRTKGSDVGYKNVTVWEKGKGKSEYTYTSPIDYPSSYYLAPPFTPSEDVDYKRGIITNEKHYSEFVSNNDTIYRPVSERIYEYDMDTHDSFEIVGNMMDGGPSPKAPQYPTYLSFRDCVTNPFCGGAWAYSNDHYFYLTIGSQVRELFGWPKLWQNTSKEYFYEGNGLTAKTLTTVENFEYNFTNKKLSKASRSNSLGEVLTTNYFYDSDWDAKNRIGVLKKTESKNGSTVLETKDINYSNNIGTSGNIAWLPKTISTAKGTNSLEPKVQFLKYDLYNNPLEAKLEKGTSVCYIWGYNFSQPIAVIENITYSAINAQKIADAQAASDLIAATDAQFFSKNLALTTNLEALRTSLPATAMMTAYIYKPLVGVVTMIDARGYKTYYSYDGFGRLKDVKDNEGNLLGENDYRYKN